jgi:hypothetical protein
VVEVAQEVILAAEAEVLMVGELRLDLLNQLVSQQIGTVAAVEEVQEIVGMENLVVALMFLVIVLQEEVEELL